MMSAYLGWASAAPEAEFYATFPYLWLVDHQSAGAPLAPPGVRDMAIPTRPCVDPECQRCANLWGGYQFRWIDTRWLEQSEAIRRPGSWTSRTAVRR